MEGDWEGWEGGLDDYDYRYNPLGLYKVGVLPNSKLLTYNIRVSRGVSNLTKGWYYLDNTTLNCIVANLLSCLSKGSKLVYSRNTSATRLKNKKGITVHKVKKCVDWLEKEGYIVNHIGVASKQVENRMSSYIEPTEKFKSIWSEKQELQAALDYLEQSEVVELRDKGKNNVAYRGSSAITNMSNVVRELNKINETATVVDGGGERMTNIYCRIFNESFEFGGRFYRADVLAIRNKENDSRLDITINGDPVVEVDYSNLHFRIAAALEDIDAEDLPLDVYSGMLIDEQNKVDRKIVKVAVNIMFNCSETGQAQRTIQQEINNLPPEDREVYTLGSAKSVMSLIKCEYPDFTYMFCNDSSYGRVLQNHDSNLASDVLQVFVDKGFPCLPVHDSFIVQKQHINLLCDSMGDCFRSRFEVDYSVPVGVKYRDTDGITAIEHKMSV